MNETQHNVNGTVAPLVNVQLAMSLMNKAMNAQYGVERMLMMYGQTGLGKSSAAAHVSNKFDAIYVEALENWTKKTFVEALGSELGFSEKELEQSTPKLFKKVSAELRRQQRPIIIDEFDHMATPTKIEIVRDVYNSTKLPILMFGEENVLYEVKKLSPRFYGRILYAERALPCDLDDARHLARLYCEVASIGDDVLSLLIEKCNGSARLITNNIYAFRGQAVTHGLKQITIDDIDITNIRTGDLTRRYK